MVLVLVNAFWKSGPNVQTTDVNDADFIAQRNSQGMSFTVGKVDMFDGYKLIDAKRIINSQSSNKQQLYRCNTGNKDTIVPEAYDFRK